MKERDNSKKFLKKVSEYYDITIKEAEEALVNTCEYYMLMHEIEDFVIEIEERKINERMSFKN